MFLIVRKRPLMLKFRGTNVMQAGDDIAYEQDILRDPVNVRSWLAYFEFKQQQGSTLEQAYVGPSTPCLLKL